MLYTWTKRVAEFIFMDLQVWLPPSVCESLTIVCFGSELLVVLIFQAVLPAGFAGKTVRYNNVTYYTTDKKSTYDIS